MAHHKRGKPKNARAGCLMCKGYKMNNAKGDWDTVQEKKAEPKLDEGLEEVYTEKKWCVQCDEYHEITG